MTNLIDQLRQISVAEVSVDDRGNLVGLSMMKCRSTDAVLELVRGNPTLCKLGLFVSDLSDVGMRVVATLSNLEWLWIEGTAVTDDGVRCLAACAKLESLLACGLPGITPLGLSTISGLVELKELSIGGATIQDSDLATLGTLKKLSRLSLEGAVGIEGTGLADLATLSLRDLDAGCEVTSAGLKSLCKIASLEVLAVAGQFDDDSVGYLADLKELSSLTMASPFVSASSVGHVARVCPIEVLHLRCPSVDDQIVDELTSVSSMKRLILNKTSVSASAVRKLSDRLPRCRVVVAGSA